MPANDSRICEGRNRWWWEGYDAREQGKPFAILTTDMFWRAGWGERDLEIEKDIPWRAPETR